MLSSTHISHVAPIVIALPISVVFFGMYAGKRSPSPAVLAACLGCLGVALGVLVFFYALRAARQEGERESEESAFDFRIKVGGLAALAFYIFSWLGIMLWIAT